jgi:thioredoxin-like negative regulator of GroEL
LCEAKLGSFVRAREDARRSVALGPTNGDNWYDKAVVHALAGEREAALEALAKAFDHGYSRTEAREDEDLRGVREMPDFVTLTSR